MHSMSRVMNMSISEIKNSDTFQLDMNRSKRTYTGLLGEQNVKFEPVTPVIKEIKEKVITPNIPDVLSQDFLDSYPDFPAHMNAIGRFVLLRTYSRFLPHLKRRETYKEICRRASEYNINLAIAHIKSIGYHVDLAKLTKECELLFDNMFNLRQFLSGRTLFIGGTKAADKSRCGNYNCSFLNIASWADLGDLFYMLLVGTGVGFKSTKELAGKIPKIRTNTTLLHSEYRPLHPKERIDDTDVHIFSNGYAKIFIGDSKEGWVNALRRYFELLTELKYEHIHTIKISYNSIRPHGERLKTFGGQASGPEPLRDMFQGIDNVLKNKIDATLFPIITDDKGYGCIRPIHVLDICNLIGNNVVVGGVRRTSEIILFDHDDHEVLFSKYGINGFWTSEHLDNHKKIGEKLKALGIPKPAWFDDLNKIGVFRNGINHRRMSNNSIAFTAKPSKEFMELVFLIMRAEGEPGFINLEAANKRRPHCEGLNPCAEILLDSYGLCNLTTVNLVQFVKDRENGKYFDKEGLFEAQRLSARSGLRMTLANLELPHWDLVQKRDRLLGTSLTGIKDAMDMLGFDIEDEKKLITELKHVARTEADRYAKELRVNAPLLVTTIKPEGTLSQVAGGVSSGLHYNHSPYYIRRIRISAVDPLAKTVRELGWPVNPEVGTPGESYDEKMKNAKTLVIDFPIASGISKTKFDTNAREQLETYFSYQRLYTEHNSSNTITVKPNEWDEARDIVYDNWDDFIGVSFLQLDGHTYALAPYEDCDKKTYLELKQNMKDLDMDLLNKYENQVDDEIATDAVSDKMDCVGGSCPIR